MSVQVGTAATVPDRDERARPPSTAGLKARFAPVLDHIAVGALEREQTHTLAYEAVDQLRATGFTRLRLPRERGGLGASLPQLMDLLIDLGAADSNLPPDVHERPVRIRPAEDAGPVAPVAARRSVIDGDKYYSTGALFTDHLLVAALDEDEQPVSVAVDVRQDGVEMVDDWNGIGQRLTASGTTRFQNAQVEPGRVADPTSPVGVLGYPLVWLILAATQAGIARAVVGDAGAYVSARRRTYQHALAERPAEDPLVHAVVGRVSAAASAARHIVLGAAAELEDAYAVVRQSDDVESPAFLEQHTRINVAVSEATYAVSTLVVEATNELFEVGGASSLDRDRGLDRHWRNARTIASHTPLVYRLRLVGDHRINGTTPPLHSQARNSTPAQTATSPQACPQKEEQR